MAELGTITVPHVAPDLKSDRPQVVMANPIVYQTEGEDLPEQLHGTRPYYFDGPEKYVTEEIVFGFGPYGFQPRVRVPRPPPSSWPYRGMSGQRSRKC